VRAEEPDGQKVDSWEMLPRFKTTIGINGLADGSMMIGSFFCPHLALAYVEEGICCRSC
jgi:hypothetical protein